MNTINHLQCHDEQVTDIPGSCNHCKPDGRLCGRCMHNARSKDSDDPFCEYCSNPNRPRLELWTIGAPANDRTFSE